MRVPVGIDEAWRALVALPASRGELAGYDGTAVLEEADDDVHVAVFRLQGTSGTAAATATLTTALAPASDGTSVAFELDLHPGPGAKVTGEEVLAALRAAAPAALAAGQDAARAAAEAAITSSPPTPAASAPAISASPPATSPAPSWSADVAWTEPGRPAPERAPSSRRSPTGALVAAGAAAALAAWALRRRG
jgi:hypothetical protein